MKYFLRTVKKEVVDLLRKTPISSEIIGLPKGVITLNEMGLSGEVIYPETSVILPPPRSLNGQIFHTFADEQAFKYRQISLVIIPNCRIFSGTVISDQDLVVSDCSLPISSRLSLGKTRYLSGNVANMVGLATSNNYYH